MFVLQLTTVVSLFFRNNNFFSKIVFDGTDGLLARVKYKPSKFGAILDEWAGLVGEYEFIFGLGLYLYNFSGNIYIYI